jgi:hypothetical protein
MIERNHQRPGELKSVVLVRADRADSEAEARRQLCSGCRLLAICNPNTAIGPSPTVGRLLVITSGRLVNGDFFALIEGEGGREEEVVISCCFLWN